MIYDVCIVGGGIFGLSSALALHKRGFKVLLLESDTIPSPRAGSTDISKIVRIEYGPDEQYMEMAEKSIKGWRKWNQSWERDLYHECGVLMMTRTPMKKGEYEYESFHLLNKRNHKPQRVSKEFLIQNFPIWNDANIVDGYYHPMGGYAESGFVVKALADEVKGLGVDIKSNKEVISLIISGNDIEGVVTADSSYYKAGKILVAGGAKTYMLVNDLAGKMKATGHPVFHLKVDKPELFLESKFPVFTADISRTGWYGFPIHPVEGVVKIANHGKGITIDPSRDKREVLASQESHLRAFLDEFLPFLSKAQIVYRRLCLYSDTRDEHFWIDRHPLLNNLFVAAGGSGHGFKFAPILGDLISDCVEGKENKWLSKFQWRNFSQETKGEEAARNHN